MKGEVIKLKKILAISLFAILLLAGCSKKGQQDPGNEQKITINQQGNQQQEVVAENLEAPWSIEKSEVPSI